jgi:hypothetical protein
MSELDHRRRVLLGRMGAHKLHSTHDSREITAAARASFLERFEREVDPDLVLPVEERQRRALHARKAYFTGLALRSATRRAERKGAAERKSAAPAGVV